MVILDTNVVSEALAERRNVIVLAWLAEQPAASVFTTAITQAEILRGIRALPEGKRRHNLETVVHVIFASDFGGRILPFDSDAADVYADLTAVRKKIGRPISLFDAQIAAIALSRGAAVATRNTKDFEEIGLSLVNPWNFFGVT